MSEHACVCFMCVRMEMSWRGRNVGVRENV